MSIPGGYPYWLSTYDTSSSGGVPIGTIAIWPLATPPSGYLICNGQTLSRSAYSQLFNVIGTTYGACDGTPENAISWVVTSGALTITFAAGTNTNIVAGDTFIWNNGQGTTYNALVATIATDTTHVFALISAGDGSFTGGTATKKFPTTFGIPNATGQTIRGSGTSWNVGTNGGADTVALTSANIASHKHDLTLVQNGNGSSSGGISTSGPPGSGSITSGGQYAVTGGGIYNNSQGNGAGTPTPDTAAGSNGAAFSVQNAYLVLNYCIKYQLV